MKTYYRILSYVKPYWKFLAASVVCTILFALLNGASIYLTIPLLSALFQEEAPVAVETGESSSFTPGFIDEFLNSIEQAFQNFIFAGDTTTVLIRICILILITFMMKFRPMRPSM